MKKYTRISLSMLLTSILTWSIVVPNTGTISTLGQRTLAPRSDLMRGNPMLSRKVEQLWRNTPLGKQFRDLDGTFNEEEVIAVMGKQAFEFNTNQELDDTLKFQEFFLLHYRHIPNVYDLPFYFALCRNQRDLFDYCLENKIPRKVMVDIGQGFLLTKISDEYNTFWCLLTDKEKYFLVHNWTISQSGKKGLPFLFYVTGVLSAFADSISTICRGGYSATGIAQIVNDGYIPSLALLVVYNEGLQEQLRVFTKAFSLTHQQLDQEFPSFTLSTLLDNYNPSIFRQLRTLGASWVQISHICSVFTHNIQHHTTLLGLAQTFCQQPDPPNLNGWGLLRGDSTYPTGQLLKSMLDEYGPYIYALNQKYFLSGKLNLPARTDFMCLTKILWAACKNQDPEKRLILHTKNPDILRSYIPTDPAEKPTDLVFFEWLAELSVDNFLLKEEALRTIYHSHELRQTLEDLHDRLKKIDPCFAQYAFCLMPYYLSQPKLILNILEKSIGPQGRRRLIRFCKQLQLLKFESEDYPKDICLQTLYWNGVDEDVVPQNLNTIGDHENTYPDIYRQAIPKQIQYPFYRIPNAKKMAPQIIKRIDHMLASLPQDQFCHTSRPELLSGMPKEIHAFFKTYYPLHHTFTRQDLEMIRQHVIFSLTIIRNQEDYCPFSFVSIHIPPSTQHQQNRLMSYELAPSYLEQLFAENQNFNFRSGHACFDNIAYIRYKLSATATSPRIAIKTIESDVGKKTPIRTKIRKSYRRATEFALQFFLDSLRPGVAVTIPTYAAIMDELSVDILINPSTCFSIYCALPKQEGFCLDIDEEDNLVWRKIIQESGVMHERIEQAYGAGIDHEVELLKRRILKDKAWRMLQKAC